MPELRPKVKKLYYSIGEVSKLTDLKAYVLRYWETEFTQLNPPKNRAGNRTYRQRDIDVIIKIKNLLYDKKYTIEGAKISLTKNSETGKNQIKNNDGSIHLKKQNIIKIQSELKKILEIISK
ncbi:MAG: transcriptional regulator [Rickettsiales bacterium]|nr:transcriptional regulator [Rickettsiales bacterium]|tara:strand:- start:512 stop:877 length:366 start_codon:yes stop_codon:yes gene_type:complete